MAFNKCNYCDGETVISAENLNCMQDAILEHEGRLDNLTPAQIGAAPDGFGLGKTSPRATDANAQRRNGYFYTTSDTAGLGVSFTHGAGHVRTYGSTEVVQNIFRTTNGCELVRYSVDSGATWTEEWVNPPMMEGVEYRTTERCEGAVVYRQRIRYTNDSTLGSTEGVTSATIPHGISNFNTLVRSDARVANYCLPYVSMSGGITAVCAVNSTGITLRMTNTQWTSREWVFDLAYTKTT